MVNRLQHNCNTSFVGKNWTLTFISCHLKLKTTFSHKYNYQQALCKDFKIINGWFKLMHNFKMKYRIGNKDIYNFNKIRFLINQISTTKVMTFFD